MSAYFALGSQGMFKQLLRRSGGIRSLLCKDSSPAAHVTFSPSCIQPRGFRFLP